MKYNTSSTPDNIQSRDKGKWDLDVFCWKLLCETHTPKRILELGTGRGLFLSSVLPDMPKTIATTINAPLGKKTEGKYTTFDTPNNEIGEMFRGKECESRIEQVYCMTKDMNPILEGRTYDMIHIDASHDKKDIVNDTINSIRLLSDHGIIVWHDFHPDTPEAWNRDVVAAIEELQDIGVIGTVSWFNRSWVAFWIKMAID